MHSDLTKCLSDRTTRHFDRQMVHSDRQTIVSERPEAEFHRPAGWTGTREERCSAPSPLLGGGEKVAAGRMRGAAAHADARNPSPPALSPHPMKGEGEDAGCGRKSTFLQRVPFNP